MGDVKETVKPEETASPKRRRKLGEVLVEAGLLSQEQLAKALDECAKAGKRLGEYLADQELVSEHDIAWRLSHQLGFLYVDLSKEELNTELASAYPEASSRRSALPMRSAKSFSASK